VTARQQRVIRVDREQDNRRLRGDGTGNGIRISALAVEQIGFGRPPRPAGVSAIRRLDQLDDRRNVVGRRDPDAQSRRANSVAQ